MKLKNPILHLLAILALLTAPVALAATDPDIDPAEPMSLSVEVEDGAEIELVSAKAYYQVNSDDLPYLRIDYTIVNTSDEPILAHRLRVNGESLEALAGGGGEIQPGSEGSFSHVIFGKAVEGLSVGEEISLLIGGHFDPNCGWLVSEAECQEQASRMQALCWGSCIGSGASGGVVVCHRFPHPNDPKCYTYSPVCHCLGRETATEMFGEGLIDPAIPEIQPWLVNPAETDMRQLEKPLH